MNAYTTPSARAAAAWRRHGRERQRKRFAVNFLRHHRVQLPRISDAAVAVDTIVRDSSPVVLFSA